MARVGGKCDLTIALPIDASERELAKIRGRIVLILDGQSPDFANRIVHESDLRICTGVPQEKQENQAKLHSDVVL